MTTRRKQVSDLIYKVLIGKIDVQTAIREYPSHEGDYSLVAAWHALMHYEADEELRKKDQIYADLQNENLEFIAGELSKGADLPNNLIKEYIDFYDDTLSPKKNSWKNLWGIFKRPLNLR